MTSPSPLDPRRFFAGRWQGQGELLPHGPARLVLRRAPVALEGSGEWLSETVWRVHERFVIPAFAFERHMFMEQVAPGLVHATADDMPLGADVELDEGGFRFRRFRSWLSYRGLRFRLACRSAARVTSDGALQAEVRLDLWRLPLATLRLTIRAERS
jgi:hypothetical protein